MSRRPWLAGLALVIAALLAPSAQARGADDTVWLCFPGTQPDPCRESNETTITAPDGSTTVEESVVPVRVRRKDGSWAAVDKTLVASGSSWVPRASAVDLTLSNGGAGPFATYRSNGQTITLSWPIGPLPAPSVQGSSLVYRGVLPGVDLWVTVSDTSFRPVLAVADAKAAGNPALKSIAYAVGVSLFGGTTQFIVTWLQSVTRDPTSPAWYVTATSLITLVAMWVLPESRDRDLDA